MINILKEVRRRVAGAYFALAHGWTYGTGLEDGIEAFEFDVQEAAEENEEEEYTEPPEDDGWNDYADEEIQPTMDGPIRRVIDPKGKCILEAYVVEPESDEYEAQVGVSALDEDGEEVMAVVDVELAYRFAAGLMAVADEIRGYQPFRFTPREVLIEAPEADELEALVYGEGDHGSEED